MGPRPGWLLPAAFVLAIGVLLLGERFDLRLLAGTALVVLGIPVVTLRYDALVSRLPSGARR